MIEIILCVAFTLYMLGKEDGRWLPFNILMGLFLFLLFVAEFG